MSNRKFPLEAKIKSTHDEAWSQAIAFYGSKFKVPSEVAQSISDLVRGMHSLSTCDPSKSYTKHLKELMLPEAVIIHLVNEYGAGEKVEIDQAGRIKSTKPVESKGNAMSRLIDWCEANPYQIESVKTLCEKAEVAHMTVRKAIINRPDIFKKSDGKGMYEIRDAKADREHDKKASK